MAQTIAYSGYYRIPAQGISEEARALILKDHSPNQIYRFKRFLQRTGQLEGPSGDFFVPVVSGKGRLENLDQFEWKPLIRPVIRIDGTDNLVRIARRFNIQNYRSVYKWNHDRGNLAVCSPRLIIADDYVEIPGGVSSASSVTVSEKDGSGDSSGGESGSGSSPEKDHLKSARFFSSESSLSGTEVFRQAQADADLEEPIQACDPRGSNPESGDRSSDNSSYLESGLPYWSFLLPSALNVQDRGRGIKKINLNGPFVGLGIKTHRGRFLEIDPRFGALNFSVGLKVKLPALTYFLRSPLASWRLGDIFSPYKRVDIGLQRLEVFGEEGNLKKADVIAGVGGIGSASDVSFKMRTWKIAVAYANRDGIETGVNYFLRKNPNLDPKFAKDAVLFGMMGPGVYAAQFLGSLALSVGLRQYFNQVGIEPNDVLIRAVSSGIPIWGVSLYRSYLGGYFHEGLRQGFGASVRFEGLGHLGVNLGAQFLISEGLDRVEQKYAGQPKSLVHKVSGRGRLGRQVVELGGGAMAQATAAQTGMVAKIGYMAGKAAYATVTSEGAALAAHESRAVRTSFQVYRAAKVVQVTSAATLSAFKGLSILRAAGRGVAGILGLYALDKGIETFATAGDYDRAVNHRATDQVFDKEVYTLNRYDFLGVPLLAKAIRIAARTLAPTTTYDAAVSADNGGVKEAVLAQDRDVSYKIKQSMAGFFKDLSWSAAVQYASLWSKPITLSYDEQAFMQVMGDKNVEEAGRLHPLSEESLRRVSVFSLQSQVKYLVFIDQKVNDWARNFFDAEGVLKPGKGKGLLKYFNVAETPQSSLNVAA